ncbi:hypothetical protein BRYFOR_08858 [Marvinbryantia formatexigens DSM 14469]|uniref:Uncharacterized protein n=1 Tax=Marvinbryantia formatexigens DSM 14469 TaxID=478749 RepID=C6LJM1_9FIRM|nr:hypothetical protein BRYFOR_08858 [Marvinbryantia formatexigens DSM 14469]
MSAPDTGRWLTPAEAPVQIIAADYMPVRHSRQTKKGAIFLCKFLTYRKSGRG